MSHPGLLLRDVELVPGRRADVRTDGGRIAEIGNGLTARDERVVDAAGAALLPGLHDHHLHLYATAAAATSVDCGAPHVTDRPGLATALRAATPRDGWVRGVGFDDGRLGCLDRIDLDAARADVPVRVQHRGGALWVVNSAGADVLDLAGADHPGIERDAAGRPTGRLWRADDWLRTRLGPATAPDLGALSSILAGYGLTGVTDATPDLDPATVAALRGSGLRQRLVLLGAPDGPAPAKIVVADHDLPTPDGLQAAIARVRPRPVAIHCASRVALVLALAALAGTGAVGADRIEHAAVCPPELTAQLAALRLTVVTQPSLLTRRGDDYLERCDPDDADALWPFASLRDAGVGVGCSSDAPYGDPDPWVGIAAATTRRAPSGRVVGPAERVPAAVALAGFLTGPQAPGGPIRTVRPGADADLVLLDRPLAAALAAPASRHVRLTVIDGAVVHEGRPC